MIKNTFYNLYSSLIAALTCSFLILISCHTNNSPKAEKPIGASAPVNKKPPSGFIDTLVINSNAAVFYNPDSVQLKKIKAITGKMVFESNTHDCFFQMRNARIVLKQYWPKIQIIEVSSYRYLLFNKMNKNPTVIDLDSKNDMCGIFLFNTLKEPLLIDMMNVDTELEFYFKH